MVGSSPGRGRWLVRARVEVDGWFEPGSIQTKDYNIWYLILLRYNHAAFRMLRFVEIVTIKNIFGMKSNSFAHGTHMIDRMPDFGSCD
jgi:hypothetical protein